MCAKNESFLFKTLYPTTKKSKKAETTLKI